MQPLKISPLNDLVYRVLTSSGEHVGNLKRIGGFWKFKAIGYEPTGEVLAGGGPLTHHHNMTFRDLDQAVISARLLAP